MQAVTGFAPGSIIDDAVFLDADTMSEAQIQSFLEGKVPACQAGYTCLKDWRDTSRTVSADAMCGPYQGESNERASRIIHKVALACGINPQVILVTLQKEQGLVTHTWPSDWRYTIAMGQGCPDTAACDARYYGFFNQVYGAAWQLKRYANPPGTSAFFTWYAPGKTWNVLYNPDRNCGSSPVRIENQATANLYYYTPYQPNAAALAAGYGTGDSCSSYGNRNFYNYFTDWFGSTRGGDRTLVRTTNDPAVYLVSGTSRWHVSDGDDYADLSSVFGPAQIVSDRFVASFTARGAAGAILRNETSGELALFQSGQRHRFTSCDLVARWGADCAASVSVSDSLFSRVANGAEMTPFYRVRSSAEWGRLDSSTSATRLYNESAARAVNGNPASGIFAAYLRASRLKSLQKQPIMFAPAQLVKADNSDRVYLTTDFDGLRWVPSWDAVAEYNRTSGSLAVVPASELTARYHEVGTVASLLTCDATTYYPVAGHLHALADPGRTGLATMRATAATCAQFSLGEAVRGALFVKTAMSSVVWAVEGGAARAVATWPALLAFNAADDPKIMTVRAATLGSLPVGVPIADGEVVKGTGATLSLVSSTTAYAIPSYAVAAELGLPMQFVSLPDTSLVRLTTGGTLEQWVSCDGVITFGAGGQRTAVSGAAAAGFSVPALSPVACARMPVSSTAALETLFVKAAGSSDVYVAQSGAFRHVQSMRSLLAMAHGSVPPILEVGTAAFARLPKGAPIA